MLVLEAVEHQRCEVQDIPYNRMSSMKDDVDHDDLLDMGHNLMVEMVDVCEYQIDLIFIKI